MNKVLIMLAILVFLGCGRASDDGDSGSKAPQKSTSYYVSTESKLVSCDDSSRGYLAYVQDKQQFEACLDSGWSVVNVKGKDGSNGKDGSSGTSGTNGSMVSGNQWYDAITGKMWVMSTIATPVAGWNNSMSACTGSYRMPSPSEVVLALTHGMKACAQALTNAPTFILANDGGTYVINTGVLGSNSTAAQFCISN